MHLAYESTMNRVSEKEKAIYKKLIEHARTRYDWVDLVRNTGIRS